MSAETSKRYRDKHKSRLAVEAKAKRDARTPEQKQQKATREAARYRSRTPEQRQKALAQRRSTVDKPGKRAQFNAAAKAARKLWTPERRAHENVGARASYARQSVERRTEVKAYMRRYMLRTKYGITPEEWDAMFEAQGRRCACCQSPDPRNRLGWATDHDHQTKVVRGILCRACNTRLGHLGDTAAQVVARAEEFLRYLGAERLIPWEPKL